MDSLASTTATVSCTVTGITTGHISNIQWYESNNQPLTAGASYTMDDGTLGGDVQTTTLTVTGGVGTETTYKCEIHGIKYETSINFLYSKLIQPMYFEINKHFQS